VSVTDDWKGEHLIAIPRKPPEQAKPSERPQVFCRHPGCRVVVCASNKTGMCRSHWARLQVKLGRRRPGGRRQ
jgi:hypothetical protein